MGGQHPANRSPTSPRGIGAASYDPAVSFEVAADAYDAFMGRWSRLLSSAFADLAGVAAGMRVIDVGYGTGALTDELLRRVDQGAVAALDPSASFVSAMRNRFPAIDIRQGSAERLPFDDGTFDVALAQLVVHFMADPSQASPRCDG